MNLKFSQEISFDSKNSSGRRLKVITNLNNFNIEKKTFFRKILF